MLLRYKFIFLVAILLLSFGLRFYKVVDNPPALNWDEVSIAYNAYSIMHTGKDEWGKSWPIHFKAYGEYKLPVQIYFSIPGLYFFGLSELGVRILPVVYGTITVGLLYFLTRAMFEDEVVSLASAFLLAISPWHIQLTRASFESSFSVFWILMGVWFLVKGFKKRIWWIIAMVPMAISVYTYNSARVFTPLFLFLIVIIYWKVFLKNKRIVLLAVLTFFILMLPLVPFFISPDRNSRYKLVSVTDDPGLIPRIEERRNLSTLPQPFPRLIHNRITYITAYTVQHYLAHFTPDFLFISGAPHKQHHPQGVGELYLFQAPLVLFGLYQLLKKKRRWRFLTLSWLFLAFVPVSITNDSIPHALRTVIANPVYQILSGLGFSWLLIRFNNYRWQLLAISAIVILVSVSLYLKHFYFEYPIQYSRDWQYGYKQVVEYVKGHQDKYDQIIFTRHYGEPHMFMLFYLTYPPEKYFNNPNLERFETHDWVRVLHFDKFYFPDLGDAGTKYQDIINQYPKQRLLFIGKPGDFPPSAKKLEVINFLDNTPAFEVVEKI